MPFHILTLITYFYSAFFFLTSFLLPLSLPPIYNFLFFTVLSFHMCCGILLQCRFSPHEKHPDFSLIHETLFSLRIVISKASSQVVLNSLQLLRSFINILSVDLTHLSPDS